MTAYIIVYRETPIRDAAAIEKYSKLNRDNAALFQSKFGTQPLAVYGRSEAPEGANPDGIVILKFPSYDAAKAWYDSPEYQQAVVLRKDAADWRVVIVEGLG